MSFKTRLLVLVELLFFGSYFCSIWFTSLGWSWFLIFILKEELTRSPKR